MNAYFQFAGSVAVMQAAVDALIHEAARLEDAQILAKLARIRQDVIDLRSLSNKIGLVLEQQGKVAEIDAGGA